jgi:hypothetical protein
VADQDLLQRLRVQLALASLIHDKDMAGHRIATHPLLNVILEYQLLATF